MNKPITLNLPESVYNHLYQMAQQKGLSLETLITNWLSNFNQTEDTQQDTQQLDLAHSPAFGIWKDREDLDVESYINTSRQSRFGC